MRWSDQIREAAKMFGAELTGSAEEIANLMIDKTAELTLLVGQPGFEKALKAARDMIAIRAGIQVVRNAQTADQRMIGWIQGMLTGAVTNTIEKSKG